MKQYYMRYVYNSFAVGTCRSGLCPWIKSMCAIVIRSCKVNIMGEGENAIRASAHSHYNSFNSH